MRKPACFYAETELWLKSAAHCLYSEVKIDKLMAFKLNTGTSADYARRLS